MNIKFSEMIVMETLRSTEQINEVIVFSEPSRYQPANRTGYRYYDVLHRGPVHTFDDLTISYDQTYIIVYSTYSYVMYWLGLDDRLIRDDSRSVTVVFNHQTNTYQVIATECEYRHNHTRHKAISKIASGVV